MQPLLIHEDVKNLISFAKMFRERTMFNRINYSARQAFNSGIIQCHFSYAEMRKCVTRLRKTDNCYRRNLYPMHCKPRFTLLTQTKERDTILRLTPRRKLAFPFKQIDLTAIQTSRCNRCFHEQFVRIPDQSEE